MKSVLAASAVMALAGSSFGAFTLTSLGMSPNATISATSGNLRYAEHQTSSSAFVSDWTGDQLMVTGVAANWQNSRAAINNSSWLAIDPSGPDGFYMGGTTAANNRPLWNDAPANTAAAKFTACLRVGSPVLPGFGDGDNLIASVGGGDSGWGYAPQRLAGNPNGAAGNGAISNVSGNTGNAELDLLESIFVGHFVLENANATLQGTMLVAIEGLGDPAGFDLNFDGTAAEGLGLFQVKSGNQVNVYIAEVPAPGALAALGLVGLGAARRRR